MPLGKLQERIIKEKRTRLRNGGSSGGRKIERILSVKKGEPNVSKKQKNGTGKMVYQTMARGELVTGKWLSYLDFLIYIHFLAGKNVYCIDEKIIFAFFEGLKGPQGDLHLILLSGQLFFLVKQ